MTVAGNDRKGLSAKDGPFIVIIGPQISWGSPKGAGAKPPSVGSRKRRGERNFDHIPKRAFTVFGWQCLVREQVVADR